MKKIRQCSAYSVRWKNRDGGFQKFETALAVPDSKLYSISNKWYVAD